MEKILVIDDERGPRESLRMLLKKEFTVLLADGVVPGLELFRREQPDLVILDIRMPGPSGIEGLRQIRQLDPDVSVIMLTGFGTLETAQEAIRLGANDYLKKPFGAPELLEIVRRNVHRTRLNRRRAHAEAELQVINRQLTEDLAGREQMAKMGLASAALVHDLRNPLTSVLGYFSLLANDLRTLREGEAKPYGSAEDLEEYLDVIDRNLKRCRELTEVWHELGRPGMPNAQPVNMGELIAQLAEEARSDEAAGDRVVRVAAGPENALITADPAQLKRAIYNVVRNALQAVDAGVGCVELGWTFDGQVCVVTVRDNGCGISDEVLRHVAEPFYTTRQIKGGTGLGLFIAHEVLRKQGGSLDIRSRPDEGTTVTLTLPVTPPPSD